MDFKKLFKDIITLNTQSFKYRIDRWKKSMQPFSMHFLRLIKLKPWSLHSIPVIINNRNRITYLLLLIKWLEEAGMKNIYIIDNASTYPPLLEYYNHTEHKVFRLKDNLGHLALWKSGLYKKFQHDYFIYSDPDILPDTAAQEGFLKFMMDCLNKYPSIGKIGFGLRVDDLPDHYGKKKDVIEWEKQFWKNKVEEDVYDAHVDTTFALYRPYVNVLVAEVRAYRITGKYMARHLPWYENSAMPTDEDVFYRNHIKEGASHWIK